ncbi:hypothetical protein ACHAXN_011756 [Cyclotella atomus]
MMEAPQNMTNQMKESLENLRASLLCPLCNQLMDNCSMLHCGHSFCHGCIIAYTCDNWSCPVVGCNLPVSAGRARGTSYVKKNSQIESVISSLLAIEKNISNAPERWWTDSDANADDKKNSIVQFKQDVSSVEGVVLDFQVDTDSCPADCKRKSNQDEQDDDASSTTKDLDGIDAANERDISDASLIETGKNTNRERVSCSVPTLFSQQFSPISIKNSQQSESLGGAISDGRQTATFSQIETMKIDLEVNSNLPESEDQKTATSSEVRAAFKSPAERDLCSKSMERKSNALKEGEDTPTTKSIRSSRVSFQPRPKVMLLYPSWTLKAADVRCIKKCLCDGNIAMLSKYPTGDELDLGYDFETESGRESFMKTLSCHREENTLSIPLSCYAISTDKDYAMDEGIVVPRSFNYYLAVAIGMPIIDVGFLSTFSSKKRTSSGHQQYPFPYSPVSGNYISERAEKKFRVIGASNYSWDAPQKALAASLDRYRVWIKDDSANRADVLLPGTDLLKGFNVIMLGEYDQSTNSSQKLIKRKKQKQDNAEMKKTRGSISILLQLCGARVYNVHNVTTMKQLKAGLSSDHCDCTSATLPDLEESPTLQHLLDTWKPSSNVIAMVKDSSCIKFAEEFLSQYFTAAALTSSTRDQIRILTSDWVLDSIGEFDVKNT